jgi:hypothetical protein
MYTEDLTIDTIDESELLGNGNWQPNYQELADQYLEGYENDDLVREAFPAIIAALAPLIPTIVQGVTSLFNRPAVAPARPIPAAPAPAPFRPAPVPTAVPAAGSSAAGSLLGLLQNPRIITAISALAQGVTGSATGSTGGSVPIGDIINVIRSLAGQIGGSTPTTGESSYLYNELGERVESSSDAIEQANTITALLN